MERMNFKSNLKPLQNLEFGFPVKHAFKNRNPVRGINKNTFLFRTLKHQEAFKDIITNNRKMFSIFHYVEAIAASPEPVLITGESGVGKELIAKVLHLLSRRNGSFIPVNIAGLDDTMFTDTLFGHKKGAYTSADLDREGLIQKAAGGTLFLDEIGDISMLSQVKLLRIIQEKQYYPLGSDDPQTTDVRIIAATNKKLLQLLKEKKFRNDLYYRLKLHKIIIPPLRERASDILLLVTHFINAACRIYKKPKPEIRPEVLELLAKYIYPGNIRELRSIIFDAVCVTGNGRLSFDIVYSHMDKHAIPGRNNYNSQIIRFSETLPTLKQIRVILIRETLSRTDNNIAGAAKLLGISRQALRKWLKDNEVNVHKDYSATAAPCV